jgi:hypothetical protein
MKKKHNGTKGAFGRPRSHISPPAVTPTVEIPYDIKVDIAKVVRSIDWVIQDGLPNGGLCFFRSFTGCTVLHMLDFESARPVLGGMVYRAGPDERRDVLAFCGPGNQGATVKGHFLGHYWIVDGNDFIDFSVGDWKENAKMCGEEWFRAAEQQLCGESLDALQWTAPDLPDFFWTHKDNVTVSWDVNCRQGTPSLGKAWYAGFCGDSETAKRFANLLRDVAPTMKRYVPHIRKAIEHYALTGLLQLAAFFFRTIKYWSGFAGDF